MLMSRALVYQGFLVLVILGLMQGLLMTSAGILIRFQTGDWLKHQMQEDPTSRLYTAFFNPEKAPAMAPLRLLAENFGNTLIYFGMVVVLVSNLGLAAALFLRPLLVWFMLMLSMMIVVEMTTAPFILHRDSSLSNLGKKAAMSTLKHRYHLKDDQKLDDPWLNGLHLVMVKFNCCGINGPHDFSGQFNEKFVPETCCTSHFVHSAMKQWHLRCVSDRDNASRSVNDTVTEGQESEYCEDYTQAQPDMKACILIKPHSPGFDKVQKTQGCFDAIFNTINSALPWLIPVMFITILTQISMVAGAIHVFNRRITWATAFMPPVTVPV